MTYLIIYLSHHGATQKIVTEMTDRLGANNTMAVDLSIGSIPDIELFDTILIGGSIHAGRIQRRIRRFCRHHRDVLLTKRLGLFLCFIDKVHDQSEFENAFPQELREHAIAHGLLRGELIIEKMNFIERLVLRKAKGVVDSVPAIDRAAVNAFVQSVREEASLLHRA